MEQNVYDEIIGMLNEAEKHIQDCEKYSDDIYSGLQARILIEMAQQKIKKLKKESEND